MTKSMQVKDEEKNPSTKENKTAKVRNEMKTNLFDNSSVNS